MARSRVVDADGHIMEPADLWEKHLESKFKDRAMRLRADDDGLEYLEIDGSRSKVLNGGQLGSLGLLESRPGATQAAGVRAGTARLR